MTTMVQPTGLSVRRRWALLATVGTGLLLITLDNSILYTALPTLTTELDASAAESLWIINAYPLVMAGLLLGSGTLGGTGSGMPGCSWRAWPSSASPPCWPPSRRIPRC